MALVSLKQSPDSYMPSVMEDSYGYGTCLRLTDDQCQALGITAAPPAGTVFRIAAVAVAKSVTEEVGDTAGEAPEVCMELQLTEMELTPEKGSRSRADLAKALYPGLE